MATLAKFFSESILWVARGCTPRAPECSSIARAHDACVHLKRLKFGSRTVRRSIRLAIQLVRPLVCFVLCPGHAHEGYIGCWANSTRSGRKNFLLPSPVRPSSRWCLCKQVARATRQLPPPARVSFVSRQERLVKFCLAAETGSIRSTVCFVRHTNQVS